MPAVQREARVGDRKSHFEKAGFISRLDRKHLVGEPRTVDVGFGDLASQPVMADDLARVGVEVLGVGLEVDPPVGPEQAGVTGQVERRGETFLGPPGLELRIGEGDPDFGHFVFGEQRVDELDACAQEAYVVHPAVRGGLRAAPHACALDVDADVVALRVALSQRDGVFALAAAQFQYDGIVVAEEITVPVPFQRVVAVEHLVEFGLHETFESQVLAEPAELVFAHSGLLFRRTAGPAGR